MAQSWKKGGLNPDKYIIVKSNGQPVSPYAEYFVLRVDTDPHARKALKVYADSVENDNPTFAKEIRSKLKETETKYEEHIESFKNT